MEGPVWTAINPIPAKSKAVAGISKAMGLRPGWPDLELIYRGQMIYIEFKSDRGRLSKDQRQVHAELKAAGAFVHVVRSVDEFLKVLRGTGIVKKNKQAGV